MTRPLLVHDINGNAVDVSHATHVETINAGPNEYRVRVHGAGDDPAHPRTVLVGPASDQVTANDLAARLAARISTRQRATRPPYQPVRLLPNDVREIRIRFKLLPGAAVSADTIAAILAPHLQPLVSELTVQESWT